MKKFIKELSIFIACIVSIIIGYFKLDMDFNGIQPLWLLLIMAIMFVLGLFHGADN